MELSRSLIFWNVDLSFRRWQRRRRRHEVSSATMMTTATAFLTFRDHDSNRPPERLRPRPRQAGTVRYRPEVAPRDSRDRDPQEEPQLQ